MFEAELDLALRIADAADEIGVRYFKRGPDVTIKADNTPVTQADMEIEAMARERIAAAFHGDSIVGEEQGSAGETSRVWIIDPIDATQNFVRGIQLWATLIAFRVDGVGQIGVVSAPALGERYVARRGAGATLNGESIGVSSIDNAGAAQFVHAGLDELPDGGGEDRLLALGRGAARSRGFGDFWGHLLVARGSAEVMVEPSLRIWDYAALEVVVTEAGGRMSQLDGTALDDHGSVLTTNGKLHDAMVSVFNAGARAGSRSAGR